MNNAVGINSAAQVYFNKLPKELDLHESAMLIGMAKNPSLFNPIRRPELVIKRRNVVFQQMFRNKLLTEQEKDSLSMLDLDIKFTPESHREGLATYFRAYLQDFMKKWTKKNYKADGSSYV